MPRFPIPAPIRALLLLAVAPAMIGASEPDGESALDGVVLAQLVFHERIIIRIPRMPVARGADPRSAFPSSTPPPGPIRWAEKRGPKCVPLAGLAGAVVSAGDTIDLVADTGERFRATLADDCPAIDFYSNFYLTRTADGMVCADRDMIRSRSGGDCAITGFKRLVAKK